MVVLDVSDEGNWTSRLLEHGDGQHHTADLPAIGWVKLKPPEGGGYIFWGGVLILHRKCLTGGDLGLLIC